MLKIRRVIDSDTTTLLISGRIGATELAALRDLIQGEQGRVALDLGEVSLVDVETVRFLGHCAARGVRLTECPAYIREWIRREEGMSE